MSILHDSTMGPKDTLTREDDALTFLERGVEARAVLLTKRSVSQVTDAHKIALLLKVAHITTPEILTMLRACCISAAYAEELMLIPQRMPPPLTSSLRECLSALMS